MSVTKSCILFNLLRLPASQLEETIHFYSNICGMVYKVKQRGDTEQHLFTFPRSGTDNHATGICFEIDEDIISQAKNMGYWKVGFSVYDVDSVVDFFQRKGIKIGCGFQFQQIGYMQHTRDPNGYSIELLQHAFESNFVRIQSKRVGIMGQPVDKPPTLGQITLRCKNADKSCDFYANMLGMKLLSVQPVEVAKPFTLYFFAYTTDTPPNSEDLSSVDNREWLWKKPYTQIELVHADRNEVVYTTNDTHVAGKLFYKGFAVMVEEAIYQKIRSSLTITEETETSFVVYDPDGYRVEVHRNVLHC